MFKNFLVTLATFSFFATATVSETTSDECDLFFERFIGPVISGRDSGIAAEVMLQQLLMIGIAFDSAYNIVGMIYEVHKDLDFDGIKQDYFNFCKGTNA